MYNRIRERNIMFKEDLYSLKFGAWYMRLYGKKKKKKGIDKKQKLVVILEIKQHKAVLRYMSTSILYADSRIKVQK